MRTTWDDAVIYQIYPRSFKDCNNDGVGDINGIIEKIPYLVDLGINAVWISPMYKSPMIDCGYDISDFCDIDPLFGSLKDFDRMIDVFHENKIKVIIDYVPNHTSSEHPWFLESKSSKNNAKRDWYIWKDPRQGGGPPNNWLSYFGGPAWELDKITDQYYLHTFCKEQPDLNWHNPEVVKAMKEVLEFWLEHGIDGFRVDAYNFLFKDQRFLDEPPSETPDNNVPYYDLNHIYTMDQHELMPLINDLEKTVSPFGDILLITENTKMDFGQMMKFYKAGSKMHKPYNFFFFSLKWNAQEYRSFIDKYDAGVGHTHFPNYVLSNHDYLRFHSKTGKEQSRCAALIQLTLRGIPTVYYGDELGLDNCDTSHVAPQDPFEKNAPGLGLNRDPSRTPFLWDDSKYAGFSTVAPWLPVHKTYKKDNVKFQSKDPHSFLNLYKRLINLHKSGVIKHGFYKSFDTGSETVYGYTRTHQDKTIAVIIQFSDKNEDVVLSFKGKIMFNTHLDRQNEVLDGSLNLGPYEGVVVEVE